MPKPLKAMNPAEQREPMGALAEAGFTDAQIVRLTGVGQAGIERAHHKS